MMAINGTLKRRIDKLAANSPIIPRFMVELAKGDTLAMQGANVIDAAYMPDVVKITCLAGYPDLGILAQKLSGREFPVVY